ncbi:TIM barrel protein [Acuticoccus sp. M5D2P5]|uniref:hydroxypyruvate isomerase family protein n=1 Tax=Acuticoccus kalidii TaxID=2910977 RepID=UPI001F40EAF7|nr:TIM barrel protein [Acuticoccus kalidii]MCF3933478.1 TIM barrel protein [Acuticoccus kalidii]
MQFSANLGFLWKERPFLERIRAARAAGFTHVEFHDQAQGEDIEAVKAALGDMPVVGINSRMGETNGSAALPGPEAEADIETAIATARALKAGAVHIVAGKITGADAEARYVSRLAAACEAAPDLTILIEPLCAPAVPGYFVSTLEHGLALIDKIAKPNVKIMYDCFHMQRSGGDVLARYETHKDKIGHIQIAGGLTRAEPDRGELDYGFLLPGFVKAGYRGVFGCEYVPTMTVEEGLSWRDAFTA